MLSPVRQVLLSGGYCQEARSFFARTSGLTAPRKRLYDQLIKGLKADGIWSTFDALYVFAAPDNTTALVNLVSSSYTATGNVTPSFAVDLGFTGNGTTQSVNTNFNPSTATSPNFVQNNANIFAWSNTSAATAEEIGGQLNNFLILVPRFTGDLFVSAVNNNVTNNSVANVNGTGLFAAERTASNAVQSYRNATSLLTAATASSAVQNLNISFAGNIFGGGTPGPQTSAAGFGSSLGQTKQTALYNRLRTFMTAIGVP